MFCLLLLLFQKRDSEIARTMKELNERAKEAEREREVERYKEMIRYQQELERQLEEQEKKRQQAYEEFLKEKLMIDEIVRKIYEEDQRWVECLGFGLILSVIISCLSFCIICLLCV